MEEALEPALFRHTFHPTLIREYDVRGIVGETLHVVDAYAVGRAFGTMILAQGGHSAAVGYDGRHSSPMLECAAVDGLRASGVDVTRIGRGPSPMLYFALHELGTDAGLMITGSHNPPDHNGIKLVYGERPVFGAELQELRRLAEAGCPEARHGGERAASVFDAYVARLVRDYDGVRPLTVAWDAGNGAAGEVLAAMVQRLPGRHVLLNVDIDGDFPAHHPDPTIPENLVQLQDAVRRERCDFGIGFDGDGDRLGVVDGEGRIFWGDQLLTLLARDVLRERPGSTIIADVKASQTLFDDISRCGGVPLMWKSGHSLLRSKLAEIGGPLAGEMSGHVFFADRFYGHDDALYAAVRFLGMAARSEESVSAMYDGLPKAVNTPELRFPCDDAVKFDVVARVSEELRREGVRLNDIDGARVTTDDGWWLLRASNTQAMLVARCEAGTEAGLQRLSAHLRGALARAGMNAPL
jgi:phosphomannomutase